MFRGFQILSFFDSDTAELNATFGGAVSRIASRLIRAAIPTTGLVPFGSLSSACQLVSSFFNRRTSHSCKIPRLDAKHQRTSASFDSKHRSIVSSPILGFAATLSLVESAPQPYSESNKSSRTSGGQWGLQAKRNPIRLRPSKRSTNSARRMKKRGR